MVSLEKRFLKYLSVNTEAVKNSGKVPSSNGQVEFAMKLADELRLIGLVDVEFSNGILYGRKMADYKKRGYSLGFVTHIDTYPMGRVIPVEYLVINDFNSTKLKNASNKVYPSGMLDDLQRSQLHKKVVFSEGNTNLGADDKAGIAVVVTAVEKIIRDKIPTPDIYFAFVSDEEIGLGASRLDYDKYKADYSFVIDGEALGEISISEMLHFSCFIKAIGNYSFLGDAHKTMVNAIELLNRFIGNVDDSKFPQNNSMGDVYIHFDSVQGDVSLALLSCSIMSHSKLTLEDDVKKIYSLCEKLNSKYGDGRIRVIRPRYSKFNTYYKNDDENIVKILRSAIRENGIEPNEIRFNGITDSIVIRSEGKKAITMGVGCGGFHSKYEWASISDMLTSVDILVSLMSETMVAEG
jgi:tripeptide aminopeptidase